MTGRRDLALREDVTATWQYSADGYTIGRKGSDKSRSPWAATPGTGQPSSSPSSKASDHTGLPADDQARQADADRARARGRARPPIRRRHADARRRRRESLSRRVVRRGDRGRAGRDRRPSGAGHRSAPKALFQVTAITYRDDAILPVVAAGPPVEEDHTGIGTMHAAELLYQLREAGLPVASASFTYEAAVHWLIVSVATDWHDTLGISSAEFIQRIADVVFTGKASVNAPKVLVVEDDIDITDLNEVVWAFCHPIPPGSRRIPLPKKLSDQLAVYLSEEEQHSFMAGKVIYNCLLADLFPAGRRPVKGSFENGWPVHIQQRVLARWKTYGYR